MNPPSEIAARLRALPELASRKSLEDELARSLRSMLHRELTRECRRASVSADVDDATQDVFLKLYERLRTGQIPPQHGREDPYVQRSARNKGRDILRGKGALGFRKHLEQPDAISTIAAARTYEDEIDEAELTMRMHEAIEQLTPTHREVLKANVLEGRSLVEIARSWHAQGRAETLAKAKQNVQKAASNARGRLRELVNPTLEAGVDG